MLRGQQGRWPGSSLTYVEPCHLLLPVTGGGCSCGTGTWEGCPRPAGLQGPTALLHRLCPEGLGAQGAPCLGHRWAQTLPGADRGGGDERGLPAAQHGSIGIGEDDSCLRLWPEGKNGERFDVGMPGGCGSCRELRLWQRCPSRSRLCPHCPEVPAWPGGRKGLKQHRIRPKL